MELSRKVGGADQRPLVRALFGLSLTYSARGKIRIGREVAEQMLVVAERLQEPEPLAYAHNLMGNTLFWLAELGSRIICGSYFDRPNETAQASSVRRVFASFRSAVSKPSVNQP